MTSGFRVVGLVMFRPRGWPRNFKAPHLFCFWTYGPNFFAFFSEQQVHYFYIKYLVEEWIFIPKISKIKLGPLNKKQYILHFFFFLMLLIFNYCFLKRKLLYFLKILRESRFITLKQSTSTFGNLTAGQHFREIKDGHFQGVADIT